MNEKHFEIICEQFEMTIEKLLQEGYSEVNVLKALSCTLWNFTDDFEEVDNFDDCEE